MAQTVERDASALADSSSIFTPKSKTLREKADNGDLSQIPNVVGMGAKDAVFLMKQRGIKVSIEGSGTVRRQSIVAGSKVTKGQQIRLILE
jgi:cell division protein FtsI (penicillin-binding protein 3)